MTERINLRKLNSLPETIEPSTLYFIRNASNGTMDIYMSDIEGTVVYRAITAPEDNLSVSAMDRIEKFMVFNVFAAV